MVADIYHYIFSGSSSSFDTSIAWIAIQYQPAQNYCWCFDSICTASLAVNGTVQAGGVGKVVVTGISTAVVGTCALYPAVISSGFTCENVMYSTTTGCIAAAGNVCGCANAATCNSQAGIALTWSVTLPQY